MQESATTCDAIQFQTFSGIVVTIRSAAGELEEVAEPQADLGGDPRREPLQRGGLQRRNVRGQRMAGKKVMMKMSSRKCILIQCVNISFTFFETYNLWCLRFRNIHYTSSK